MKIQTNFQRSNMSTIYSLILLVLMACTKPDNGGTVQPQYLNISLNTDLKHQTIYNFGASDAWACQFVGKNWPLTKKEQIADYLFSTEFNQDGSPKGIGLSTWRFNIGAGSTEQGGNSNISDEWRRAEGFMQPNGTLDWTKHQGQRWFLQAAKERGVNHFTGFVNSPSVALTKNSKAYSSGGNSTNLKTENFNAYADFLVEVISHLKTDDAIELNYISPFNEPQWDWADGGQEGCPWLNTEVADLTKKLNQSLSVSSLTTKIELPEAAQLNYLYEKDNKPERGEQIETFFNPSSASYVGNLEHVAKKVAGHSYYTTWNLSELVSTRTDLASKLAEYPNIEFAMSEYCLLENNSEVKGNGRDLGVDPALYMARIIHTDLTVANASSWQWWLAVSPYDYKDGLVYIDKNKSDGIVYDSKMLWALGNYSLFIRPGMKRIGTNRSDNRNIEQNLGGVMVSSYLNEVSGKTVTVAINYGTTSIPLKLDKGGVSVSCNIYRTAAGSDNLKNLGSTDFSEAYTLAPSSITSFVEL